jgi:hypothetical protein
VTLLQRKKDVVQIAGGFVKACLLGQGGSVDDKDNGADMLGVLELSRRKVAQLAVAGCVEDEEVAGTLESRVAGGAVVSGGGDMGLRQRGLDGEGCCRRVGGGQGATFGLRAVSGAASRASKRASTAAEGRGESGECRG